MIEESSEEKESEEEDKNAQEGNAEDTEMDEDEDDDEDDEAEDERKMPALVNITQDRRSMGGLTASVSSIAGYPQSHGVDTLGRSEPEIHMQWEMVVRNVIKKYFFKHVSNAVSMVI